MYFSPQHDFVNTRVFLPPELQYQPNKKTSITLSMLNSDKQKKLKPKKPEGCGPLGTDVQVGTRISLFLNEIKCEGYVSNSVLETFNC